MLWLYLQSGAVYNTNIVLVIRKEENFENNRIC